MMIEIMAAFGGEPMTGKRHEKGWEGIQEMVFLWISWWSWGMYLI
jgi:hypothetical protein